MRPKSALIALTAALTLLGGCASGGTTTPPAAGGGLDALSAIDILAKVQSALAAKDSIHIKGRTTERGDELLVDLIFIGDRTSGTISTPDLTMDLVVVKDELYVRTTSDQLWLSLARTSAPPSAQEKYLKLDGRKPEYAFVKDMTSIDYFIKPVGALTKVPVKTFDNVAAVGLMDEQDKRTLYVANEGEPLPVRLTGPLGSESSNVTFEFNVDAHVEAPAADQVIDPTAK
jgi:hypothetical protein